MYGLSLQGADSSVILWQLRLRRLMMTMWRLSRRVRRRGIRKDTPQGLVAESKRTLFQQLIEGTEEQLAHSRQEQRNVTVDNFQVLCTLCLRIFY